MWKKSKPYILSILLALAVGGLSALLTADNMNLYTEIRQPPLAPPSVLFPIVWSILYILMGISAAMVWNRGKEISLVREALTTYGFNLAVNFFWSILFFNLRAFLPAFIWLCLLWALILSTILKYAKFDKTAAFLQIPYLVWVTFAGYLNFAVWLLNR